MKEDFDKLLSEIDVEIAKIDLYGNDIIETSLSIVRHLQSIITGLRNELQTYTFPTQEDEIRFFKVQKPELLGRLLYFHKICRIEMQCPNGSNEVIRKHLIAELDNLTYFFNRNLDFYQYYRSHSTMYDKYYFVRGKADIRLCADSAQFDKDPNFSTGYDYTVAKILANEMLRIYLNQRLQLLEKKQLTNDIKISLSDFKLKWTTARCSCPMTFTRWRKKHSGSTTPRHRQTSRRLTFILSTASDRCSNLHYHLIMTTAKKKRKQ